MAWRVCFMKWAKINSLYAQILSPKSSRLTIRPQQRCGFKKAQRQAETKRGLQEETDAGQKHAVPPLPGKPVPPMPLPPRKPHRLFRPLVFTVGFTGCSFGTAAILQYESVKSRVQMAMEEAKEKKTDKLGEGHNTTYWHNWWNQLSHFQKQVILVMSVVDDWWSGLSEGQKTVTGIIALNTLVLCCWRIPSMQRSLVKYFTSNPASSKTQKKILRKYLNESHWVPMFFWIPLPFIEWANTMETFFKTRCLPMVLSSFSHYSIIHMLTNMYVLWTFSTSIVSLLGREQFLALYLSGGVISTFVSYVFKTATGRLGPSLGASGAIMTVLAAVCTKIPEAKLGIVLLPMVSFTAGNALKALVALDIAGLLLGWRFFDHAAHLGGALFGVWYIAYGNEMIWRNREPLVRFWHELRNKPNGRPRPGGGGGQV